MALSLVAWTLATGCVHRKVLNLERGHSETSYVWISESFFSHFKVGDDLYVWVGRLLDERYAISSFLETMDANDFGSTNALKSLWLTPARFRAEKDWERYEWPMRWWKKYTQWPLERSQLAFHFKYAWIFQYLWLSRIIKVITEYNWVATSTN